VDSHKNTFPILIHEIPLHDVTVGVWCVVSATRTLGKSLISVCIQNDFIHTFGHASEHLFDFSGEKILSASSFGGEVKPSVPCRKFTACKRTQK